MKISSLISLELQGAYELSNLFPNLRFPSLMLSSFLFYPITHVRIRIFLLILIWFLKNQGSNRSPLHFSFIVALLCSSFCSLFSLFHFLFYLLDSLTLSKNDLIIIILYNLVTLTKVATLSSSFIIIW